MHVDKVKALKSNYPEIAETILNGIGEIAISALELISSADFHGSGASDALGHLGALIGMNHGFLVSLRVSHPRLERIRELVDYAILVGQNSPVLEVADVLSPFSDQISKIKPLKSWRGSSLQKDFKGADGVGVLWPAVFRNGIDGKPGEAIDQEMFEKAEGVEGINQLVGVGVQENREGWEFWTRDAEIEEVKHDQNVHRDQNEKLHDEVRALRARIEAITPAAPAKSWAAVAANGNTFQKLSDAYPDTYAFIGSQLAPYIICYATYVSATLRARIGAHSPAGSHAQDCLERASKAISRTEACPGGYIKLIQGD
ncbi:hypothetical protein APSETT445_001222 [Aspergillus pseudonomiae]